MDLTGKVVLSFNSRRARGRSGVHGKGIAVYSFRRSSHGGYYVVGTDAAQDILRRNIPGVTRLRKPYDDLRQCWG